MYAKKRESEREGREGQEIGKERGGETGQEMRWGERGRWERGTVRDSCTHGNLLCRGALFWNALMRNLTWENIDE